MTPRRVESPTVDPFEATLTMATAPKAKRKGRNLGGILRVSQRKGREGSSFMSPTQQRELIEEYAKRNGDTVLVWYDETDSVSGGSVDRVGLKAALRDALSGRTDGVIVAKVNRFARSKRAGEALIYDLIAAGKSFIAVANNLDSAGARLDRGSEVYLDFLLRQAEWEREDLQSNWLDVRARHIAEGRANRALYGYRKRPGSPTDPATGKLVKVPAEAKWVRFIFTKRAAGWSWIKITDHLNEQNVPPPAPLPRKDGKPQNRATRWHHNRVSGIVDNRTYLGELRSGEFVNPAAHAPIVTLAQWEGAHNVKATPTHRRPVKGRVGMVHPKQKPSEFLLTGLLRCATCGGRMNGGTYKVPPSVAFPKGYRERQYRCRRRQPWGVCPRPAQCKADDIEALVLARFEAKILTVVAGDKTDVTTAEVQAADDELAKARADLNAFVSSPAIIQMTRELGHEEFDRGVATRLTAVTAAEQEYDRLRLAKEGVNSPGLVKEWGTYGTEKRRLVLSEFFTAVAVAAPETKSARVPVSERWGCWRRGNPATPTLPGVDDAPMKESPIDLSSGQ